MKDRIVVLEWKKKNEYFQKELERYQIIKLFEGLIKKHPENCEVSKKIVEVLPEVDKLYIDWDSQLDVKELYYQIGDETKGIPIIHHNKVIWNYLKLWCMR